MKKAKVIGAIFLASAMLSAVADAGDGKKYIGAFCTFADDDNSGQDRNNNGPFFGNVSGSTRKIICPILQDNIESDIEYANIIASATMDEDTCRLWERADDGSYGWWLHDSVSYTGGGYNLTRWFPGSDYGNSMEDATYAITCDIAHNGSILSYELEDR